jgi:hypothetical protein
MTCCTKLGWDGLAGSGGSFLRGCHTDAGPLFEVSANLSPYSTWSVLIQFSLLTKIGEEVRTDLLV